MMGGGGDLDGCNHLVKSWSDGLQADRIRRMIVRMG